jgi:Phosphotransferase enzyme family
MTILESVVGASESRLDRIEELLAEFGQPLATEVARVLREVGAPPASDVAIELQELQRKHPVYRVRAVADGWTRSVIIKRLDPGAARRNRLVVGRWLPWLELQDLGAALLGAAAADGADWIWQIYEDMGDATLHAHRLDRDRITAAVESIADLHCRAGGHPVVTECRRDGHDLGMHFFTNAVGDAASLLDALEPPALLLSREQAELRDRLRHRLDRLLDDAPRRARVMAEAGGPDTMLHGDLWTTNILLHNAGRHGIRLIDWDRVGAGSFSYDLSILLNRFAAYDRVWILNCYRTAVARAGWRLAPVPELNLLFDTAECARYACCLSWPAIALLHDGADWGFAALAEIDAWFQALEPVIHG